MAQIEEIGNIKGPKGDDIKNPRLSGYNLVVDEVTRTASGPVTTTKTLGNVRGAKGDRGDQGLPGANALPTAEVIAQNLELQGPAKTALDSAFTKRSDVIAVKDFGAVGDGVVDDTAALQAALDVAANREVMIPRGRYNITSTLNVPTGATLRGQEGTVLVNAGNLSTLVQFVGAAGAEVKLATAVGTNDRTITTSTAHGLVAGDVVRFTSQRISTSADAGDWRLGWATTGGAGPFFGEFGTVQSVTNSTTFVLDAGLIFPGYRPDNTMETDANAGSFATVAKIVGARNVVIRDFAIDGPSFIAIYGKNAVDCLVDSIRYVKPDAGRFIQFDGCYRTEARDCWVQNDVPVTGDLAVSAVNSFHIVGSQATGFDRCTAISGTQAFDITYLPSSSTGGRIVSSYCYVRNSRSSAALDNALTVHPGVFAPVVIGNDFSECRRSGVAIRGNRAIVVDNVIRGSGVEYGLYISEGGGKDSLIAGNQVANFDTGMAIIDGSGKLFDGRIGVVFDHNMIVDCLTGFSRVPLAGRAVPTLPDGVSLVNNTVYSSLPSAVAFRIGLSNRPVWGMAVRGSTIRLTGSGSTAFLVGSNARATSIVNNRIIEAATMIARDSAASEHVWPTPSVIDFSGNTAEVVTTTTIPGNDANFRMSSRDRVPHIVAGGISLENYRDPIVFRTASSGQSSIQNGFPTDAAACDIEVIRRSSSVIVQRAHYVAGDMYNRATNTEGQTFPSWVKKY